MARILYALSGQGRGHTSRVMAISAVLRRRGHEITYCCGGTARRILEEQGERVLAVPALKQVMEGNEVRHLRTMRCNIGPILRRGAIVDRLAEAFRAERADLLITDFEAFSPLAADRVGLPVISFNHQEVLTETDYRVPARYWLDGFITLSAVRMIAPRTPMHTIVTSFTFPPLKQPARTTIVPPILRQEVLDCTPRHGEHILVYYNQPQGAGDVLDVLASADARFIVYNFEVGDPDRYPNITFKAPCLEGFLRDLATSRGVLCTAGFTLISESLYLGKPLLVAPNRGIFEQTLNALWLEEQQLGQAVLDEPLSKEALRRFLSTLTDYQARLPQRDMCGNEEAAACIEGVLARLRPSSLLRPASETLRPDAALAS